MSLLTLLGVGGPDVAVADVAYAIPLGFVTLASPADGADYFAGVPNDFRLNSNSGTWAAGHFEIPVAGTITTVSYSWKNPSTAASGESVITAVRLNDTTDIASTDEARFDVAFETLVVSGLSQAVAVGDKIALKAVMPTFGTNPGSSTISAVVYIS